MQNHPAEMQRCIDACLACYQTCYSTAMGHCLKAGGDHTEPAHFSLMLSCAEICRTAAHAMLSGSGAHIAICEACATVCKTCADDCEDLPGMEDCVKACRNCAEQCLITTTFQAHAA